MVTIYVFRMTGMTKNLTKAQASLGKGIVIARGSAHQVYVASQTLKHSIPPTPSHGRTWSRESPACALQEWAALRPQGGRFPGAETWSSFLYFMWRFNVDPHPSPTYFLLARHFGICVSVCVLNSQQNCQLPAARLWLDIPQHLNRFLLHCYMISGVFIS